ncbi:MAG TPA: hypothetical protein VGZ73_03765 [Bryobacteraceae bacterium]|jgi:hypothetical protein|nr:hypothetical protein [Bryobacteraceae bacterium]
MKSNRSIFYCVALAVGLALPSLAQTNADLKQILERLDRIERENDLLRQELRVLREELHPSGSPSVEERLAVQESRIAEQAQTKVESSQRFPIRLTGTALVNAFINSKQNGGADYPTAASLTRGNATGGASWRQTTIGLDYRGPQAIWGGTVRGSVFMDFNGGTSLPNNQMIHLRTAEIAIDWSSRTFMVGQDKPIFSPRNPDSLAQVGVTPLAGSGNLWFWEPQARFEQRFKLSEQTTLRVQAGVVQTSEFLANLPTSFTVPLERYRPGGEARVEIAYGSKAGRRIEIAPGFHYSTSHVAGASVPSDVASIDWLLAPTDRVEFEGAAFTGQNLANFGLGTLRQGFTVLGPRDALAIHAKGGWSQITLRATDRLSFHLMGGIFDGRNRDLLRGDAGYNHSYGGNLFYRIAPNVIVSLETMQMRTLYLGPGLRINNHYDLAIAYLF